MKLKVQFVFDATQALNSVISANRPMPSKGKYRLARMQAKLMAEWTTINDQRSAKIISYDHKNDAGEVAVPDDKMPEFTAWWAEFAKEEIEVAIEPIPFALLDLGDSVDGGISAAEFIALGDLVAG